MEACGKFLHAIDLYYQLAESKMSKSKTFLIGRDSETGHLTSVKEARANPKDHTVERMPKRGYGDS